VFVGRLVRTLGDIGFAAWCLSGTALVLVPLLLNAHDTRNPFASLLDALDAPLNAYSSDTVLIYQALLWSCIGGFWLWLASLAVEWLTTKR
jgi:site-specific recombinase